jgi:hypothetical protein
MTLAFSIVLSLLVAVVYGAYLYLRYHVPLKTQTLQRELELTKDYAEKVHGLSYKILDRAFAINGTLPMDEEFDKREPVDTREPHELSLEELQERLDAESGGARRSQGTIGRRRELVGEIARRQMQKEEVHEAPEPVTEDTSFINSLEPEQIGHLQNLKAN